MTSNDSISDDLFEEATAWHVQMREPTASPEERQAFARWLDADGHNRAAYDEVTRLWEALAQPAAAVAAEHPVTPLRSTRRPEPAPVRAALPGRSFVRPALLAASVALMLAVGGWGIGGGFDDLRSDHVTAVGQRHGLDLADGSRILLNTDTALAVDLGDDHRRVRLYRGEAFFDVAPDAARPFTVRTGTGEVRVLGTRFNVRVAADRTIVTVIEGTVRITADGADPVVLTAGQAGSLAFGAARPSAAVDPSAATAWQRGQMVFYRTPLGEVVDELNRYHRGRIMILTEALRDRPVTGVFDATRPAAVVDLIESTLGVQSTRLGQRQREVLSGRAGGGEG